ncbi:serine/threonine protein kinase, partial [Actinoplanes philippinensis]|uniref:serine/threonine protein kinase n=1 Tax=Actinoplanes philippinensis TaxID=35752 RepID=UPI0033CBA76D
MSGWVDGPLARREFRLVRLVRNGGEGEVWQAERTDNDVTARWAVKILLPERIAPDRNPRRVLNEWMRRWQQTMMRVGALHLPGIVFPAGVFTGPRPYTGGGPDDTAGRALYMISRWVDGGRDLDRWRTRHFDPAGCRRVLEQICALVESLGDEGMVHGDLTPGNIMIEHDEVRLIDFTRLTHTDATPVLPGGTRGYMAPELSRPGVRVDPAVDRYAVGTVAYFLLTGVDPPQHDAASTVRRQLPRYGYPEALAQHVAALLHPEPRQRPRLGEWAADLGRLLGGAYHSDGLEDLALAVDAAGTARIAAAGGRGIAVARAGSRHQPLLDPLPFPAPQGVRAVALARRGNGDVALFARGDDRSVTVRADGRWRTLPGVTGHGPILAATGADGSVSAYVAGDAGLTGITVPLDGEPTVTPLIEGVRRVLAVAP